MSPVGILAKEAQNKKSNNKPQNPYDLVESDLNILSQYIFRHNRLLFSLLFSRGLDDLGLGIDPSARVGFNEAGLLDGVLPDDRWEDGVVSLLFVFESIAHVQVEVAALAIEGVCTGPLEGLHDGHPEIYLLNWLFVLFSGCLLVLLLLILQGLRCIV